MEQRLVARDVHLAHPRVDATRASAFLEEVLEVDAGAVTEAAAGAREEGDGRSFLHRRHCRSGGRTVPRMGYAAVMTEPLFAPDSRRRLGLALVAYGIVGLVLAVTVATAGILAALRTDDAMARLEAQRTELVAAVATTTDLVGTLADTLDQARPGLEQVTVSAGRLSALSDQISTTADELAGRLDVQILGLQPFAGLGVQVRGIAEQTRGLQGDLATIAPAITAASEGTGRIADGLRTLETRLTTLEGTIGALGPFDEYGRWLFIGLVLVVLLDIWLAIPAALAIVVGRRLRRV